MKHAILTYMDVLSMMFQQRKISFEKKNFLAAEFMNALKGKDVEKIRQLCQELELISQKEEIGNLVGILKEEWA